MQIADDFRSAASAAPSSPTLPALKSRPGVKRLLALAVREPLVPFLLAGGAIFGAYFAVEAMRSDPIRYTPEIATQLARDFQETTGRKPNDKDLAQIRDTFVGDELLFREALARNMHLSDPETRERLIDRLRYLVVGAPVEPSEDQLIDYYASHPELYRTEPGVTFTQVFFAERPRDPAAILAQLERGETVKGDDFWLGREFPNYGNSMIRGMFGQAFLKALADKPAGHWYGPVQSARGWHFFRKSGAATPVMVPYPSARAQVRQDYMMSNTKQALDKEIEKLKEKYDVEITG